MPLSRTTVRGKIRLPTDVPATITAITFTLMNSDYEGDEWVAKKSISAELLADGQFEIEVWPNDVGDRGDTKYSVSVALADGASVDPVPNLFVRNRADGWDIDDLVLEQTTIIPGYVTRVMTRAEYQLLTSYTPHTLYLVKV